VLVKVLKHHEKGGVLFFFPTAGFSKGSVFDTTNSMLVGERKLKFWSRIEVYILVQLVGDMLGVSSSLIIGINKKEIK
jgi:hypothetical protein